MKFLQVLVHSIIFIRGKKRACCLIKSGLFLNLNNIYNMDISTLSSVLLLVLFDWFILTMIFMEWMFEFLYYFLCLALSCIGTFQNVFFNFISNKETLYIGYLGQTLIPLVVYFM